MQNQKEPQTEDRNLQLEPWLLNSRASITKGLCGSAEPSDMANLAKHSDGT